MITKKLKKVKSVGIKIPTLFRPQIRSRHGTHRPLRTKLPLLPFRSVIRLGSTTQLMDNRSRVELNSVQGVKNSANKLLMKQCFTKAGVKTADWFTYSNNTFNLRTGIHGNLATDPVRTQDLPYPIISKSLFGSRGVGNVKHDNQAALESWMKGKNLSEYIFEAFFGAGKRIAEYRIHCTSEGAFYNCRKMLKRDTPEAQRFQRHSDNCIWVTEDSPTGLFNKPNNWDTITAECVKALKSLGLDLACFDIKVLAKKDENGKERQNPDFIIIESNSAASLMDIGIQKYIEVIPKLLKEKYINNG